MGDQMPERNPLPTRSGRSTMPSMERAFVDRLSELQADATPAPWQYVSTEPEIMAHVRWHGPDDEEYPSGTHLFEVGLQPIHYDWQKDVHPGANAELIVFLRNNAEAILALVKAANTAEYLSRQAITDPTDYGKSQALIGVVSQLKPVLEALNGP